MKTLNFKTFTKSPSQTKSFPKFGLILASSALISMSSLALADNHGHDLNALYLSATEYDAGLASARAAYLAEKEQEDIAQAGLKPSISAEVDYQYVYEDQGFGTGKNEIDRSDFEIRLSQPLFNAEVWYNDTAAEKNTLRANSVYLNAQQNLILDVATAYFSVLRGVEDVTVAKAIQAAVKRQYEQAKEQFDVGLIAITDVHEAQALFDDANTTRIRSEGALTIAKEQLSRLTGEFVSDLHELDANFSTKIDDSFTSEDWVASAENNNLQIKTAEFAYENLKSRLKASKAGHFPTLSFNARYFDRDNIDQTNSNNFSGDSNSTTLSLDLSVPIYSGGATQAGVRQTRYQMEQARFDLESAKRQARIEARTEYINLRTNSQTVDSLKQNIVSRESALEATREGYNVGTRNIVEVLDAERNYYTALRDYAAARFDFIESSLRLKLAAGTLSGADIAELNQWLKPTAK